MKKELKERIYKAQCIGNVEPIEYMIPYPSMRSLIEGQNIKFSQDHEGSYPTLNRYGWVKISETICVLLGTQAQYGPFALVLLFAE